MSRNPLYPPSPNTLTYTSECAPGDCRAVRLRRTPRRPNLCSGHTAVSAVRTAADMTHASADPTKDSVACPLPEEAPVLSSR
ncbi:unnamed protein product [Ectocarpus sp. CCAP 1310/34]|nr:unnamed protein product [Ectocarpus sp. CCAP 1310/34]